MFKSTEAERRAAKKWYWGNRLQALAASAKWQQRKYTQLREQIVAAYGHECACCHERDDAFLSIDHIHGGGNTDRHNGGSIMVYKRIVAAGFPKDQFQLLCMNCNFSKGRIGYCPHALQT